MLNIGFSYTLAITQKQNMRINGGIYNITDVNFYDIRSFSNVNVNIYGMRVQDGRRYWISVSYDF